MTIKGNAGTPYLEEGADKKKHLDELDKAFTEWGNRTTTLAELAEELKGKEKALQQLHERAEPRLAELGRIPLHVLLFLGLLMAAN